MHVRLAYSLAAALLLAPLNACDSDDDNADGGSEHHEDAGEHHHDEDGGEEHAHEDGGDDHEAGSCPHMGSVVACDEEIESKGATADAKNGTMVEVVGVQPGELTAGADGDFMVMMMIKDASGDPVDDGVELDSVYTKAHGGHMSCGAPTLLNMGGGSYHIHGLTYPHGGTWYHDLHVADGDDGAVSLALCVANP